MGLKEDVIDMKKQIDEVKDETKNQPLMVPYVVYEAEQKRKQNLIIILIIAWFLTMCGIIIYSCLPDGDYSQETSFNDNSEVNQNIGDK